MLDFGNTVIMFQQSPDSTGTAVDVNVQWIEIKNSGKTPQGMQRDDKIGIMPNKERSLKF